MELRALGLEGARLLLPDNPVLVAAGATVEQRFQIAARPFAGAQDVNHFQISAEAAPAGKRETFAETFLMPPRGKTP